MIIHQVLRGVGVVAEWVVADDEVEALLKTQPTMDPRYVFWVFHAPA